jgi:cytochrome c oxidase subunit 3
VPDVLTKPVAKLGGGGIGYERGFGGGGGGGGDASSFDTDRIGLWVLLGSITMLFAAFTSAYLVRRAGADWAPLHVPPLLWVNTAVLLLSSLTMELARRSFLKWKPLAFRRWMSVTFVLGALFLVGQFLAWNQLAEQGIFLHSNPHSSFFYVLTGVHGLHIVAGVLALLYVQIQAWRYRLTPGESIAPSLAATYWHFVDGVWIYLFVVLFLV